MSRRPTTRRGFTLVEAMVSLSIMGLASGVLLLSTANTLQTVDDSIDRFMALGMAQQLMDEIAGMPYMDPAVNDPYQLPIGPTASEQTGPGRSKFNDLDDYNGLRESTPRDRYNVILGRDDGTTTGNTRYSTFQLPSDYFARWRQEVDVYYVNNNNLSQTSTTATNYRAIRVKIFYDDPVRGTRELANLTRVVAYVPSS